MMSSVVRLHSGGADGSPILLAATLYVPPAGDGPFPGLVVGHGASSRRLRHDGFCREAAAEGFVVLAVDFRGHGDSEGAADGPLEDDLSVAAAFLRRHRAVDRDRICYRGSSMGGFYGLKAAAAGHFAAVALICPASETVMLEGLEEFEYRDTEGAVQGAAAPDAGGAAPSTLAERPTRWDIPATRKYFGLQDSMATAARVTCPVLLVHARGDDVVPLQHSLDLAGRLAGDATVITLAGGSHTSAQHDPEMHSFTARWLLEHAARSG